MVSVSYSEMFCTVRFSIKNNSSTDIETNKEPYYWQVSSPDDSKFSENGSNPASRVRIPPGGKVHLGDHAILLPENNEMKSLNYELRQPAWDNNGKLSCIKSTFNIPLVKPHKIQGSSTPLK